jgi:uncharacterized protein RhaS with RHS repeats
MLLLGHRYYLPAIGRFLTPDPIGHEGGLNLYAYADNNPLRYIDPDGLDWKNWLHNALDAAGMTPALGAVPDLINAGVYLLEGDGGNAAQSAFAAVPGIGDVTKGISITAKAVRSLDRMATASHTLSVVGRSGKQARLRELATDDKLGKNLRGWIKQEENSIARGKRKNIRNPPGYDLAHKRGFEARKGHSYKHSDLQNKDLHRLQHKHEGYK